MSRIICDNCGKFLKLYIVNNSNYMCMRCISNMKIKPLICNNCKKCEKIHITDESDKICLKCFEIKYSK
jgi:hypothetical protein